MICTNCGAEQSSTAKYCASCGTPLNTAPVRTAQTETGLIRLQSTATSPTPGVIPKTKTAESKITSILAIGSIAVLLLTIVFGMLGQHYQNLNANQEQPKGTSANTASSSGHTSNNGTTDSGSDGGSADSGSGECASFAAIYHDPSDPGGKATLDKDCTVTVLDSAGNAWGGWYTQGTLKTNQDGSRSWTTNSPQNGDLTWVLSSDGSSLKVSGADSGAFTK